jgi:hypothetical protein
MTAPLDLLGADHRQANWSARFVLWVKSDVPNGSITGEVREIDNGRAVSLGGGKTDDTGSFRLTDVVPPTIAGDADVQI